MPSAQNAPMASICSTGCEYACFGRVVAPNCSPTCRSAEPEPSWNPNGTPKLFQLGPERLVVGVVAVAAVHRLVRPQEDGPEAELLNAAPRLGHGVGDVDGEIMPAPRRH